MSLKATNHEIEDPNFHSVSISFSDSDDVQETHSDTSQGWQNAVALPTGIMATCLDGILNVAGGPAAFWRATDVFYLRNENNNEAFCISAMIIGGVALVRYFILNTADSDKYKTYLKSYEKANLWGRMVRTIESPTSKN